MRFTVGVSRIVYQTVKHSEHICRTGLYKRLLLPFLNTTINIIIIVPTVLIVIGIDKTNYMLIEVSRGLEL